MKPLISFENVSFQYSNDSKIFEEINFDILAQSSVALVGPSGSGKTTLLSLIGGIIAPTTGTIRFLTQPVRDYWILRTALHDETFWIMQSPNLFTHLTVNENLQIAKLASREKPMVSGEAALEVVEMEHLAHRKVSTLSGGQAQRVAVARALTTRRSVILADEPTASLDQTNALSVGNALRGLTEFGKTVIIATHDLGLARLCDAQFFLRDGRITS